MIDENMIRRINELAKLKKSRKLTQKESQEQKKLREQYLELFRTNMKSTLNNIDIVDEVIVDEFEIDHIHKRLSNHPSIKKIEHKEQGVAITYICKEITHEKILATLSK